MTTDFYNLLLSDCALAALLLVLFWYVQRISARRARDRHPGRRPPAVLLGAAMLDGTSQELTRSGDLHSAYWTAGRPACARAAWPDWHGRSCSSSASGH